MQEKKKKFIELPSVEAFIGKQCIEVQDEYRDIVAELEKNGRLMSPTGEKVDSSLFVIRVIQTANIRVFYLYGLDDVIWGIHGYVKKTKQIPIKELKQAKRVVNALRAKGFIL